MEPVAEEDQPANVSMSSHERLSAVPEAPIIVADDRVRAFVAQHGGRLYVWAVDHRCCSGRLSLLETDVARPARWRSTGEPIDAGGFELFLDGGFHGRPQTLVLDLGRRGRKVRAFWNDCAFIP
jgi:hypothetical protein